MSGYAALATRRAQRRLWRAVPLFALGALLSGACSAANAQSWQCRAREGTYDYHDIPVTAAVTEVSGEMMIRKSNGLSKWNPTARVAFIDTRLAESDCHCNGIVATWFPEQPDTYQVSLLVDGKEEPFVRVHYGTPVKFKLSFAWDGALKLEMGGLVATGNSQTPMRDNLHLACSTADVDFNLAIVLPPKPSAERCPVAIREQWSMEDVDRYCRPGGKKPQSGG